MSPARPFVALFLASFGLGLLACCLAVDERSAGVAVFEAGSAAPAAPKRSVPPQNEWPSFTAVPPAADGGPIAVVAKGGEVQPDAFLPTTPSQLEPARDGTRRREAGTPRCRSGPRLALGARAPPVTLAS